MSKHETAKFGIQPFGIRCEIFMCTNNSHYTIGGSDACPQLKLNICHEDAESLIRSAKDIPELAAITKEVGLKIAKKGEESLLREAKEEAEAIIAEAKKQAEAIILEAQEQAEAMAKAAQQANSDGEKPATPLATPSNVKKNR